MQIMKKIIKNLSRLIFGLALAFIFEGCASVPTNAGKRELNLSGISVSETDFGGTVRWYAVDKYNYDDFIEEIRFQVGYFNNDNSMGFILYGNGTDGELAYFSRQGLDLRWDWGSYISPKNGESAFRYAFVIEPDSTGLYYDFSTSTDGTSKPRGIYKVHKF